MHRIFISINIPQELKNIIEAHIEGFYKNNLARVAEKENWHVTVVFCGHIADKELEKLKETTKRIASETKKFELVPKKIIFAPLLRPSSGQNKKPRMVWITFKNTPQFTDLSKKFAVFADKKTKETFPHITIVRFKDFHYPGLKKLLPEDGIYLDKDNVSFEVTSIEIMESHLQPTGPKYKLLEKINLP